MKFNLGELESLFGEIKKIITFVEEKNYSNRRQQVFFANGERITISLPDDSVPHLLGVNINYLRATGLFKSINSFELLKEMCDNPYTIHSNASKGIINYDTLFSKHILKKLESFHQNLRLDINEIDVVCKYNPEKCYLQGELTEKYDYLFIKRYANGKFGILALTKNSFGYNYTPMSNQLYDSYDEIKEKLEKYLKNQDITIISGIKLYNTNSEYKTEFHTPLTCKEEKFAILKTYKSNFNCTIDVSGEYDFCLDKLMSRRDTDYKDNDLIEIIVNSIKEGKLIETPELDSSLKVIIDAFNDHLCFSQMDSNETIEITFSDMKKELLALKDIVKNYEEKNIDLERQIANLSDENDSLKKDNEEKDETIQKVFELVKPRN